MTSSAAAIRAAGRAGLEELLVRRGVRYQRRSLTGVLAWAAKAPEGDTVPSTHQYILSNMEQERQARLRQIAGLEAELLTLSVRTPSVLLLGTRNENLITVRIWPPGIVFARLGRARSEQFLQGSSRRRVRNPSVKRTRA